MEKETYYENIDICINGELNLFELVYDDGLNIIEARCDNDEIIVDDVLKVFLQAELVDYLEQKEAEEELAEFGGNEMLMHGMRMSDFV